MKKCLMIAALALLLTGCGKTETFETISDEMVEPVAAIQRQVMLELPEEAAVTVMESEAGKLYLCENYEIGVQTFSAGDINSTVQTVTGYERNDLTILETESEGFTRYEFVWCAVGENGDQIGRAALLDDGSYHYVLSTMAHAEEAGRLDQVWNQLFDSFGLS